MAHFSQLSAMARQRAGFEEESISFRQWELSEPYPTSSLPALQAAKCAWLQGEQAFLPYHIALFKAFFEESRDISDREVLITLAKENGLDVDRFVADFDLGSQENEIFTEYEDIQANYEGWGIPVAIVGGRYPVLGASPSAVYRRAIDLCLASEAD